MTAAAEKVDLDALLDLTAPLDLTTPWCLRVGVTLRVADHIAAGLDQVEGLTTATTCDPYALHSVLSHLARKGVFREVAPGQSALNQTAERLREASQFLRNGATRRQGKFHVRIPDSRRGGLPRSSSRPDSPIWPLCR